MIELKGLRKRFGEQVVLDGVDFTVREGETVHVTFDPAAAHLFDRESGNRL